MRLFLNAQPKEILGPVLVRFFGKNMNIFIRNVQIFHRTGQPGNADFLAGLYHHCTVFFFLDVIAEGENRPYAGSVGPAADKAACTDVFATVRIVIQP